MQEKEKKKNDQNRKKIKGSIKRKSYAEKGVKSWGSGGVPTAELRRGKNTS